MSNALTSPVNRIADYVDRLAASNPQEALQIALAESERQRHVADQERALASQAQAEYRAMAEVEFDSKGRITKANLAGLYRLAAAYAKSRIVPDHYQSKYKPDGTLIVDATPDCFIAVQMAFRLGIDPLAYMQASFIVHGKPGIEAKLATALLNTSGKIKGRIRYRDTGKIQDKSRSCTAFVTDAETGDTIEATVDWAMVEAEGWLSKSGSKWKTMPDVMLHYRSAVFLIRQFYSEVLMGIQTVDELEDATPAVTPARNLAELTARIEGPANGNGHHAEPEDAQVIDAGERPQTTDDIDQEAVDNATLTFLNCTTEKGLQYELNNLPTDLNDKTMQAIAGAAHQRREAIREAEPKGGKTQKQLA